MNKILILSFLFLTLFELRSGEAVEPESVRPAESLLKERPEFSREYRKMYYYVDEWASFPHADEKKFLLLFFGRDKTPAKIFNNSGLLGNPDFYFDGFYFYPFLNDAFGDEAIKHEVKCEKLRHYITDSDVSYLNCESFPCVKTNERNKDTKIINPFEYRWYLTPLSGKACPWNHPFKYYRDLTINSQGSTSFYYLKPFEMNSKYASFEMEGKKYYLDLRDFKSSKESGKKYLINNWDKPLKLSDFEKRWINSLNSTPHKSRFNFFDNSKKCLANKDLKCLASLSISASAYEKNPNKGFYKKNFTPIVWDSSNVEEATACINSYKKHADFTGVELLIGKHKKCLIQRSGNLYKFSMIDYPEAFNLKLLDTYNFQVVP